MRGSYDELIPKFIFVDCRYDFEYKGGHIKSALHSKSHFAVSRESAQTAVARAMASWANRCSIETHEGKQIPTQIFLAGIVTLKTPFCSAAVVDPYTLERTFFDKVDSDCVLIFHCEFSQERGPKMYVTTRTYMACTAFG